MRPLRVGQLCPVPARRAALTRPHRLALHLPGRQFQEKLSLPLLSMKEAIQTEGDLLSGLLSQVTRATVQHMQGCIKSQHCLSDWFLGIASPPVQCSNTGLKKRNQKSHTLMQPSNVQNCCSCHSDLTGLPTIHHEYINPVVCYNQCDGTMLSVTWAMCKMSLFRWK